MKNGFKLFLLICFAFTFVFSLAFAGPTQCAEGVCCNLPEAGGCQPERGVQYNIDGECVCLSVPNHPCYVERLCW